MALEKLTLHIERPSPAPSEKIEVLFNPEQITISRSGWSQDNGELVGKDEPATINVTLFFDTTLLRANSQTGLTANLPTFLLNGLGPEDVRRYTQKIYNLTRKTNRGRPPFCRLTWGRNILLQRGILTDISKTLTHFWEDGTPVRAQLVCTFQEFLDPQVEQRSLNPIDDPIRIVRQGETLSSIAQEEFGDPALWRAIALANNMDNPRQMLPGQQLTVPPTPDSNQIKVLTNAPFFAD